MIRASGLLLVLSATVLACSNLNNTGTSQGADSGSSGQGDAAIAALSDGAAPDVARLDGVLPDGAPSDAAAADTGPPAPADAPVPDARADAPSSDSPRLDAAADLPPLEPDFPDAALPDAALPDAAVDLPPLEPDFPDAAIPDLAPDRAPEAAPPAPDQELVFVANQDSNDISGYVVNLATGTQTPAPGSPFPTGDRPYDMVATPNGRFLLVGHYGSEDVRAYRIQATGRLTAVPGGPVAVPHPQRLVMSPTGRFVYAHSDDGEQVYGVAIDEQTGALHAIAGPLAVFPDRVNSLAFDPKAHFFAAITTDPAGVGKLHVFNVDAVAGTLQPTAGSPVAWPGNVAGDTPSMAFHPSGAYLYAGGSVPGGAEKIFGFAVHPSTGAVTPLGTGPWEGEDEAHDVVFHPSQTIMYWGSTVDVRAFAIGEEGDLTPLVGSPYAFNNNTGIAVSANARFIYVVHQNPDELRVSSLDTLGAVLQPVPGSPWSTGTNAFAVVATTPRP